MTTPGPNTGNPNSQVPNWAIAGGMGNLFGGLLGGGLSFHNPADAANPYLSQMGTGAYNALNPYMQSGLGALPQLSQAYGGLLNDPTAMMKKIGETYQASPGYQYNVDQATQGANRAAAAGGMVGSPAEQQELAQKISGIASQDYNNYLNQGLGLYGQGLSGMSSMADRGLNASTNYAKMLQDQLLEQAKLAYAGQANKNESQGGMFGGLGGLLGAGLSFLPGGSAISAISNMFGGK